MAERSDVNRTWIDEYRYFDDSSWLNVFRIITSKASDPEANNAKKARMLQLYRIARTTSYSQITPLYMACKKGYINIVVLLLPHCNLSVACRPNQSPLLAAIDEGHALIVMLLLKAGVNTTLFKPLLRAAQSGHANVVKSLLTQTSWRLQKDEALSVAVEHGWANVVSLLIADGADVNALSNLGRNQLVHDYLETFKNLLAMGAGDADIGATAFEGETPLVTASRIGNVEIVDLLLKARVNVNVRNSAITPLFYAALMGHTRIVQLLLSAGARYANQENKLSPLFAASLMGHADVVRLLLDAGYNPDITTNYGITPLYCAIQKGHSRVARLLLTAGADKNLSPAHGESPLVLAVHNGDLDLVNLLLDKDNINKPTSNGIRPLHEAARSGHTELVRLLLKKGAERNLQKTYGETPIYLAAQNGHFEAVELLLSEGADSKQKTANEITPLLEAARNGHAKIVELLHKNGSPLMMLHVLAKLHCIWPPKMVIQKLSIFSLIYRRILM